MGVEIGSLVLPADMLVLDMHENDVIIGMDWLAAYRAMIDCFGGSIFFAIPGQEMFLVAMPRPEGGSTAHLYYLEEDTSKEVVIPLDSIPVVREYSDVFQEIPGLPPQSRDRLCHRLITRYETYSTRTVPYGSSRDARAT